MTCRICKHEAQRFGYYGKRRIQRYRCTSCHATFADSVPKLGTHHIDPTTAAKALELMLEGMSVRAISRITGMHKNTVLSLMSTAAEKAKRVFDTRVRDIRPNFVQLDELWCMVGAHGKNVKEGAPIGWGDQWVWLAIDSETKAILSYHISARNTVNAFTFVSDLSERTLGKFQITTDALRGYVPAIEEYYGDNIHFAQLQKIYTRTVAGPEYYGGGKVIAAIPRVKTGKPDFARISTSHIERANLTVRMHLRRFARKTNAISKTFSSLESAVALFVCWYNFCRTNSAIRVTPAMQAKITDHVWSIEEMLCVA
jgi:transposase-like protein/IS1 family transposase